MPAFAPTAEQAAAIDAFAQGRTLALNACAGSGKTATLLAMARTTDARGLYLVFNRAAADDARGRFPRQVDVLTSHSLALRHVRQLGYADDVLFQSLNANAIERLLGLRGFEADGFCVRGFELGHAVRCTIEQFCRSDSPEVHPDHVPRPPLLDVLSPNRLSAYLAEVTLQASRLWERMADPSGSGVPLGHDGYFKIWSMSCPQLACDYVLLDEAQDSNPALIHVLAHQERCRMVFVGDRHQQIYAWRGAVDAMDRLRAEAFALSRSFRCAQRIAELASAILEPLGNTYPMTGRTDIDGAFSTDRPDAIIARTNSAVIETLISLEACIERVHVIGEGRDILQLLDDVQRLQLGRPASFGEFFGFASWQAVTAFCDKVGTNSLTTIVQLVEKFGEQHLRRLVSATCADPRSASVTVCTAHKAKGLEFDEIRLTDDFHEPIERGPFIEMHGEAALDDAATIQHDGTTLYVLRAELRLLYVAVTRARYSVAPPDWCRDIFHHIIGDDLPDGDRPQRTPAAEAAFPGVSPSMPNPSTRYAILDFETTGLDPKQGDRVIEIGIALLENGREIDAFQSLINPGVDIPSFITELTGIDARMVRKAPPPAEVFRQALDFIGDAQLVAHNAGFDAKFLHHELQSVLGIRKTHAVVCTLLLSRRIFQALPGHKLGDVARHVGVRPKGSHRALADAQATGGVLGVMLTRLQRAWPEENIDPVFLLSYQKRAKGALPDLTTERDCQAASARVRPVAASRTRAKRAPSRVAAGPTANALEAARMNERAQAAIAELESLLGAALSVDSRLDWSGVGAPERLRIDTRRRPWIDYRHDGRPASWRLLTGPGPRPSEPDVPPCPERDDHAPRIGLVDRLAFRAEAIRDETDRRYRDAVERWVIERDTLCARHAEVERQWRVAFSDAEQRNDARSALFQADEREWDESRTVHEVGCREARSDAERWRSDWIRKVPHAVERYAREVLARSSYPTVFPSERSVRFEPGQALLDVQLRVIRPDELPELASVGHIKSRDEIRPKLLSKARRNALYVDVVRSVCIRTLHELFASDSSDACRHAIVSVYVDAVDPATGLDSVATIASVKVNRLEFECLRLDRVSPSTCFEGLGGRGSTRGLPRLAPVEPFDMIAVSA